MIVILYSSFVALGWGALATAHDGLEFVGKGQAKVVGGNQVSARGRALRRAQRDAVAQAVGGLLGTDALGEHAADLRAKVYPRAASFIRTYRVVHEGVADKVFSIEIAATLALKPLKTRLQALTRRTILPRVGAERPSVAILAKTPGCADAALAKRVASQLAARLRGAGFSTTPPIGGADLTLARRTGAKAWIRVELRCGAASGVRGIVQLGAKVAGRVDAMVIAGGIVIAARRSEGWGFSKDRVGAEWMAVEGAIRQFGAVVDALRQRWPALALRRDQRMIRLSGLRSYQQHRQICAVIEGSVDGVRGCSPRRLSAKEAWFSVETGLSPATLASRLSAQRFGGFRLVAKSAEGQTLRLAVEENP